MEIKKALSFASIEILLTTSVLLILISIQIPTMSVFWQMRVIENHTYQLLADIESVRCLALERRETLRMEFYGSGNYYRYEIEQAGMGQTAKYVVRNLSSFAGFPAYFGVYGVSYLDETGKLVQGSINFGGSVTDIYGSLAFSGAGTPSAGGHIILIGKRRAKGLVIIVKPVTGRARIGQVLLRNLPLP